MVKTYRLDDFNYEVELGKYAQQADGAVWFKYGGTVVLATAVSSPSKEFPGFLPLTVEYREQFAAAGKIPGGYFKREGKPTDHEVLTARLVDRSIRPLFPADFFEQVQIIITVYSLDKEHAPHTVSLIAASLALTISKIPFLGPISAVEAARIDGNWVMNPSYPESVRADAKLIVAGTDEGITMVEGSSNALMEKDFVDVLFRAHDAVKPVVKWQEKIRAEVGVPKQELDYGYNFEAWRTKLDAFLTDDRIKSAVVADKAERNQELQNIKKLFDDAHKEELLILQTPAAVIDYIFDSVMQDKFTHLMFAMNKRVDGRTFDEVRPISIEVGLLPFTHGSSLFQRGQTQALVSVTLGGGQDEQRTENLLEDVSDGSFMLHYNFPPFSVGEAKFLRGPGRREVGHGSLAASALKYVRPNKEEFPYTIRVVSDILESNGSSSMATVCGATMALMQAGVPITNMVSGIAMGLIRSKDGKFKVLTDISGFEDAFGLMDFKVAGTDKGITAIQMDIKYKGGLARDIFEQAMVKAREGRLFILGKMRDVLDKPAKLSDLVPRVTTFKINTDKIGAVIGSGGKTIREIIEATKTTIDIEEDGLVKVFGDLNADTAGAIRWIKTLTGQINVGEIFDGKVRRTAEFGVFVELVPGVQGLMHVSKIPREKQRDLSRFYKNDDDIKVEVLDYDDATGRISLKEIDKK
jgi:polyribonucleotide nucleotidyltransferase